MPVSKSSKFKAPKLKSPKLNLSKDNLKLLIAIVGGVALVAIVAVVIFFIINSSTGGSSQSNTQSNTNQNTPTNVVSSLTCTREGTTIYNSYGAVTSGTDQMIAMYSNDILSSFGTTTTLDFESEEAARSAQSFARSSYDAKVVNAGLTQDPFTSSYNITGNTLTVTHQAEGDDITSKTARILGLYVISGEPVTDIDTLLDSYETDGYTCVEK